MMQKNKEKMFSILILSFLVFYSLLAILFFPSFLRMKTNEISNSIPNLKLSSGEIIIKTPVNTTYTSPMSGYYPGTHGFENDDIGGNPADFNISEESGAITIDASLDGHSMVLNYDTTAGSAKVGINQTISQQTYGTIEFWVRTTDSSGRWWMSMIDASDALFQFEIENGWFRYWNGGFTNIVACASNTWYHIRIDIELTAGGYQGLGQNQFYITIDGTKYGPYNDYLNPSDFITFYSRAYDTRTSTCIDAVGYSWDPNYNIGDNLNEGLLLSFDNTTTLSWIGYSLDGQINKTILGDTVIPMPNNGLHKIQVFANNSMGTMIQSDIRYFTINMPEIPINLIILIIIITGALITGVALVTIKKTREKTSLKKKSDLKTETKRDMQRNPFRNGLDASSKKVEPEHSRRIGEGINEEGKSIGTCDLCGFDREVDAIYCPYCGCKFE